MNNENTNWFSQTLLTYKDKRYQTDGYMRIAISTNTENYQHYNLPLFNISISNQISKSCNLSIQNAEDLLESFTTALQNLNEGETIVEKNYNVNTKLFFKFTISTSTNERVVVIDLISNETDSTRIIVPLKPVFQSFLRRLRGFVDGYNQLCFMLLNKTIDSESLNIIKQLPSLIKGISSQIISNDTYYQNPDEDTIQDSRAAVPEEEKKESTSGSNSFSISDLDRFMEDNLSSIKIPEIDGAQAEDKKKKAIIEIDSPFVEKILKNDLSTLENKITSFAISKNPLSDFVNDIQQTLKFDVLDGATEKDKKSMMYIAAFLKDYYSKSYTINGKDLPPAISSKKFNGSNNQDNVELAKDLVLFIGYMRTVRRRLENKLDNAYDNKAMVYILMRCILDPIYFSYIDNLDKNDIVSSLSNRYQYYDSIGVFDCYKQLLKDYNCTEINERDIIMFCDELSELVIGKVSSIEKTHDQLNEQGVLKLPSQNDYNLEQIINEIVPLEVEKSLGTNLLDDDVFKRLKEQHNISEEIEKLFKNKSKVKPKQNGSIKAEKITPLYKWVDKFKQDVPPQYRDKFLQEVKGLEYNIFEFSKSEYPLNEFDERIIKALYIWDPNSDVEMKSNFEHFASLIEDEPMTKENILISAQTADSKGWEAISNFA